MNLPFDILQPHAGRVPHLRSFWRVEQVSLVGVLCLPPPLWVSLADQGTGLAIFLAASLGVVLFWQALFGFAQGRLPGWDALATAICFALLADGGLPLWQSLLALSFGVVLAEQIFGGRGFSFLNPVVVSLAFLGFAFPGTGFAEAPATLGWAVLPGAVVLIWLGLISARMLLGLALVLIGYIQISGLSLAGVDLLAGHFLFAIAFLAGDAGSAAATRFGRWAHGALIAGLIVLFSPLGGFDLGLATLVPALLLAGIFAPLLDMIAIKIYVLKRRSRHG